MPYHMLYISLINIVLFYGLRTFVPLALFVPMRGADLPRIVTLIVAHADEAHLWGNTIEILTLGVIFEIIHGTRCAAFVYWSAGIIGSVSEIVLWDRSATFFLGASSGVYGMLAAYVSHLIINFAETPWKGIWTIVVIGLVIVEISLATMNPSPNIAYAAHGYGAIAGFVAALFTVENILQLKYEWWIARFALFTYLVGSIVLLAALVVRINEWEELGATWRSQDIYK